MDSNKGVPFWPQQDLGIQRPWPSIAVEEDQTNQPPRRMGFLSLLNGDCDGALLGSVLPPDCNSSTVPDRADQVADLNTMHLFPEPDSSAESQYGVGRLRDSSPHMSVHELWPGAVAAGDPSDWWWQQTTHTSLMAYADAAAGVASGASFFTPLLLSQIGGGGCAVPFAAEQPSMNGNVMVSSSLSNFDLNLTQSFFSSGAELEQNAPELDFRKAEKEHLGYFSSGPELDQNAPEPDFHKHLPQNATIPGRVIEMADGRGCSPSQLTLAWLHHQGSDVYPAPGATRFENFNQNVARVSELESYASANVVRDDRYRYGQEALTGTVDRYLTPQCPWTPPAGLERKKHLDTEFISMDNRDLMPQYPWTPARTEKNRHLQAQTPTEFINVGNRGFMPQHPWAPANQEISRLPEIIDLVDDLPHERNYWEEAGKLQNSTPKRPRLSLLESLVPPPPPAPSTPVSLGAAMPLESNFVRQQQVDTEELVSTVEPIDQTVNAAAQDLLENDGIDLNKTPRKKMKRKKLRPKVIREGKPVRTPKPATPTPKNPSGKRKYVRKNKTEVALKTPSTEPAGTAVPVSSNGSRQAGSLQKRRYKRKNHPKSSPDNPYSNAGGAAELEIRYRNNAVRRQLNFNDEDTRDSYPRSTLVFPKNVECQYQEAYYASSIINTDEAVSAHQTEMIPGFPAGLYSSNQAANGHIRLPDKNLQPCTTESVRSGSILEEFQTRVQQALGNLVPGNPIGQCSSVNQVAYEHIRLADKVQPCRTASMRTDQILGEFRTPENQAVPPRISKRENMKKLARKSFLRYASNPDRSQEPDVVQLDSLKTSNVPRKRRIGDYILDNNAQSLMDENFFQAADKVMYLNQSHNACSHETYLSQIYNKQGAEHENGFTLTTASSLIGTPASDYRKHQVKSDKIKGLFPTDVKTNLASENMLALVPYSHSSVNPAQGNVEQNKITALLESFPCNYKQHNTKSRLKEKTQALVQTNQGDLQGRKTLHYSLDDIIQMLRHLTLDESYNLLVPYEPKKPHTRAKVDLDPETTRVWNRLMGKDVGEDQETDVNKEKWEEERRTFSVRVESFIKRMHLVQGDRRFSKWKGSVVDSVVGVFLTQNVSDHLSSSAFMALAARFPPKSRCKNFVSSVEESEACMKHEDSNAEIVKGNSKWQEHISSDQQLHGSSPLVITIDNEVANSNESFGSNSSDTVANYTKVRCVDPKQKVLGISHDSPDSESITPITLTNINLTEAEERSSVEDAGSSQNSSENPLQDADQIRITSTELLNCGALEQPYSQEFATISGSVPVADLYEILTNCTQPLANAEVETYPKRQFYSANNLGTDLNEAPVADHFSKQNESVFEIHEAVESQLQNQNFDNQQHSAVSEAVFQSHREGDIPDRPYSHFPEIANMNKVEKTRPSSEHTGNISEVINLQDFSAISGTVPVVDLCEQNFMQPLATTEVESYPIQQFTGPNNLVTDLNIAPLAASISQQDEEVFEIHSAVKSQHLKKNPDDQQNSTTLHNTSPLEPSKCAQLDLKHVANILKKATEKTPKIKSKEKKVKKNENEKDKFFDWESLRKEVIIDSIKEERSQNTMDSVDWEAVRSADVKEISDTIKERGMNNMLAERIKEFLNRLVEEHKSIDLEWLRKVEPGKAKDYLLSIRGLGLKSVECVRLLTLHNLAFPVDTNVGRICVRLGWVPLQPLPDSVQLHLLELYPILETIQKYLWPRLCMLDQRTLYELHYQLITFGKVFCTKSKPNCNACPMRGECKHFASAFASSKLKLTGPEEKSIVNPNMLAASQEYHIPVFNPAQQLYQLEGTSNLTGRELDNCQPIIEEPASPEPECTQIEECEIEDAFYEDPDEIPTIKLNIEEFTQNLQDYMQANMEIQDVDVSSNLALVISKAEHASIPMPKLKNVSRLRTEHLVYQLPDSHPLLEGFEPRESDDPSSYLLAIWTAGETAQSTEPPKESCNSNETGVFCNMATCFTCSNREELQAQIVRGTILIPCRTAMRGSFPLNGTYFQVNEVFADHDSSRNPIDVPRAWIWNLPRRTVFFGTSVTSIFKGLTTEQIQFCFWRGFVCVRGFDRKTRAPRPLYARLHFPASKAPKNKPQEKRSSMKTTTNNTSEKGSIRS